MKFALWLLCILVFSFMNVSVATMFNLPNWCVIVVGFIGGFFITMYFLSKLDDF